MMMEHVSLSALVGQVATCVIRKEVEGNDGIVFCLADGREFALVHSQSCCERVHIDDIEGDLDTLEGSPILVAEAVSNAPGYEDGEDKEYGHHHTWTFFKFATVKGHVDVRFYGSSNGNYSESASLFQTAEIDLSEFANYAVHVVFTSRSKLEPYGIAAKPTYQPDGVRFTRKAESCNILDLFSIVEDLRVRGNDPVHVGDAIAALVLTHFGIEHQLPDHGIYIATKGDQS